MVPPQVGNLSRLQFLDLSERFFLDSDFSPVECGVFIKNHQWLSHLSRLEYLNLDYVQVRSASTLLSSLNMIPSLAELHLHSCFLETLPSLMPFNSTSLRVLDLSSNGINSTIPLWLFELKNLEYLDLSGNSFQDLIPDAIGNLTSLVELHLSDCSIDSLPSLMPFNSTSLRVLDLSSNDINSTIPLWLFELKNLDYLDLSNNSFRGLIPDAIGNLTSLKILRLSGQWNGVIRIPRTLGNLCMLNELDLSGNNYPYNFHELGETFSGCLNNSLETLSWSTSNLKGHLPEWLGMLKNLKNLDLSWNSIHGPIPLSRLSSLRKIIVFDNELNGSLPESLGQLQELVYLDLSSNNLQGELVEAHFAGLTRLKFFDVSYNKLSLNVASDWSPPPLLTSIGFGSCNLGPQFPTWLQKLKNVSTIYLPQNGISSEIPGWFWNFSSVLHIIDLSQNEIKGQLPNSLEHLNLEYFDLSDNHLEGPLPLFSSRFEFLMLSNNSFSGVIPPKFFEKLSGLNFLYLSANNLSGSIHHSVCKLKFLEGLDLSKNHLSGEIPGCWNSSLNLQTLNLGNNHLLGSIPKSICSLLSLYVLQVSNNNLSGELPLQNCTHLVYLDLGGNKFSGNIPLWIGEKLKDLYILRLRSNMFTGTIPNELGNLASLRVIDLAHNNLSGGIPRNFGNLTSIRMPQERREFHEALIMLDFRGREDEYYLSPVTIDLAANSLYGVIPEEIATLYGLQNLNLSGNHLTGKISEKIGMLRQLESLDLSCNSLSGPIPTSMTVLSFLDHLNLSFNDLSGRIPSEGQFQTLLDPSIYTGNHDLCGLPLKKCHDDDDDDDDKKRASQADDYGEDQHNESDMVWFYTGMALGFVVGFWAVCGPLLLNRKWRIAYFRFVENLNDRLHVAVAVNLARIRSSWFG